jgi:hypothetical protein
VAELAGADALDSTLLQWLTAGVMVVSPVPEPAFGNVDLADLRISILPAPHDKGAAIPQPPQMPPFEDVLLDSTGASELLASVATAASAMPELVEGKSRVVQAAELGGGAALIAGVATVAPHAPLLEGAPGVERLAGSSAAVPPEAAEYSNA